MATRALGELIRETGLSVPKDVPRQVQDAWIDAGKVMRDRIFWLVEQAGVEHAPVELPEIVRG